MIRLIIVLGLSLAPTLSFAGEKIAGINTFAKNQLTIPFSDGVVFWTIQDKGRAEMTEGPLEAVPVECHGSGFWKAGEQRGEGICMFGEGEDTFTYVWKIQPMGTAEWHIRDANGKYAGMTGQGKSASRTEGDQRITNWVGEIELP